MDNPPLRVGPYSIIIGRSEDRMSKTAVSQFWCARPARKRGRKGGRFEHKDVLRRYSQQRGKVTMTDPLAPTAQPQRDKEACSGGGIAVA